MAKSLTARQAIRVYLATHEKSQDWLAAQLDISSALLSRILAGYRTPSDETVEALKRITGVNLREFRKVA